MVSKAVVFVFTSLFLALLAMLIVLSLYAYDDDQKKPKHKDPPRSVVIVRPAVVHQDRDFTRVVRQNCTVCAPRNTRQIVCQDDRFVIVVAIEGVGEANEVDSQIYYVRRLWELKSSPTLAEAMSRLMIATQTIHVPEPSCEINLEIGKEYLVSGSVDDNLLATVNSCDLIIEWKTLGIVKQHEYVSLFESRRLCQG